MSRYDNIRKIVKNGRNSYYINIPKYLMKELKWKEKQKLIVKKRGEKIIVEDWPAPPKRKRKGGK